MMDEMASTFSLAMRRVASAFLRMSNGLGRKKYSKSRTTALERFIVINKKKRTEP